MADIQKQLDVISMALAARLRARLATEPDMPSDERARVEAVLAKLDAQRQPLRVELTPPPHG